MSTAAKLSTTRTRARPSTLTHLDRRGRAKMVDVGDKPETIRHAIASTLVRMSRATLALVVAGSGKKGDVIATASLAAVTAIKRTSDLIPLCHPVRIVGTDVDIDADPSLPGLRIRVGVRAHDRTGVEMEAMVGAAAAALTVYDMVKGVEKGVAIQNLVLLEKGGGRSGLWRRGQTPGGGSRNKASARPARRAKRGSRS